jgi:type II secretory pathway component GspD/PulD (secretin)
MAVVSSFMRPPLQADAGLSATRFAFRFCRILALATIALACAVARPAAAQDSDTVTLNFVNADIDAVVKAVAEISGRNFVVDSRAACRSRPA